MRQSIAVACLLALTACGPQPAPEPTPEELGQDEPGAPMEPAPDARVMRFDAISKTAEAFTGGIALNAEPRPGPNAGPRMKLVADNGLTFYTELMPGAAAEPKTIDWKAIFGEDIDVAGNAPPGAASIDIHSVVEETVPKEAVNGGFCGKDPTAFIAMATGLGMSTGSTSMSIAAFKGNAWPPENEAALCGTFNYTPAAPR